VWTSYIYRRPAVQPIKCCSTHDFQEVVEITCSLVRHPLPYRLNCRPTWINGEKISDVCFADNIALLAGNNDSLQQMVDNTPVISRKTGMQPRQKYSFIQDHKFSIHVSGQQLAQTCNFVCLHEVINMHGRTEAYFMKRTGLLETSCMSWIRF